MPINLGQNPGAFALRSFLISCSKYGGAAVSKTSCSFVKVYMRTHLQHAVLHGPVGLEVQSSTELVCIVTVMQCCNIAQDPRL